MPTIKRRNVLTLLPLTAMGLGLAACADNPKNAKSGASGSGASQEITVTLTDDACKLSSTSFPSGVVTFTITNSGSAPNELEILTEDKLQIVSEQENIGPGTTTKLTTSLKEGTYYAACKPNMVGELKGVTELKITKGAAVDISADETKAREAAVTNYTAYVRDQTGQLLTATQGFVTAYTSGDTATAKSLYPLARQFYERIEPTAESFGLKEAGDLDAALDTRVQDLASGAGKAVTDKDVLAGWTGWHRIEADLWAQDSSSPFKFADDARPQEGRRPAQRRHQVALRPRLREHQRRRREEVRARARGRRQRRLRPPRGGRQLQDRRRGGDLLPHRPLRLPGQCRGRQGRLWQRRGAREEEGRQARREDHHPVRGG